MAWRKPYSHLVEYLDALLPLLAEQKVSTSGEFVTHHTDINVPGPAPEVMLAALGPRMLKLAAERTAGTITWMTGPTTIAEYVRPTIGPRPEVVAAVPVWITDDIERARERSNTELAIYGQLPSYRAMLDREGMETVADMVLIGDPDTVRIGLDRYRDAGASEIVLNVLGSGESVEEAWKLAESLGGEI